MAGLGLGGSYAAGGAVEGLRNLIEQRRLEAQLQLQREAEQNAQAVRERELAMREQAAQIDAQKAAQNAALGRISLLSNVSEQDIPLAEQETPTAADLAPTGPATRGEGGIPQANGVRIVSRFKPMTVPGLRALGQEDVSIRPIAREEAMQRAAEAKAFENDTTDYTLSPGQVRMRGNSVIGNAGPDTTAPLDQQLLAARRSGNQQEAERILKAIQDKAMASRDPTQMALANELAQARLEAMNNQGQVIQGYDPTTGKMVFMRYNRRSNSMEPIGGGEGITPPPSMLERQATAQFRKARPVFESISELSEKINVGRGVEAKAQGEAAKAAARLNLNDDVAEYESLVSGFTPLVARAVGHSGVLTEQDVRSVRALFPQPGDSKSLRDRKIARMEKIMGGIEAGMGNPGGQNPPAGRGAQQRPIPGVPGGVAELRDGKWIRVK